MATMLGLDAMFDDVKRMDKRQFIYQVLSFGMIVSSALMIWKGTFRRNVTYVEFD